jgi:hypothetical protein
MTLAVESVVVAAWTERNPRADSTLLNPCIFLTIRRAG